MGTEKVKMSEKLKATWPLRLGIEVYEDQTQLILAVPRSEVEVGEDSKSRLRFAAKDWQFEVSFLEARLWKNNKGIEEIKLFLTGNVLVSEEMLRKMVFFMFGGFYGR